MSKVASSISFLAIILSIFGLAISIYIHRTSIHYGFVNTEKLLNSFVESQKAMDEIRAEEQKWSVDRKIIEDSLKSFEDFISKNYSELSVDEKNKVKIEQVSRIEELGHFNQARSVAIQNMRLEKLQNVYQKINAAMADFAMERNLDVLKKALQ